MAEAEQSKMRTMRARRNPDRQVGLLVLALAAVSLLGVGCGGSSDTEAGTPTPKASEFPAASGQTLTQLTQGIQPSPLVPSPAGQVFDRGPNRYSFGVFTKGRQQVSDASVALYFAPGANGKAKGPFPARIESLQTPPAYRAQTTANDPDAATTVYVVPRVNLNANGEWRVVALFRTGDGLQGARLPSAVVGRFTDIPKPGEKAPLIHTPTVKSVGGAVAKIDTRVPPDQMHQTDFADALGKEPVVLLFATPQFCQSRTCGPVVDIAQEVQDQVGEKATFIHMEVYKDNDPGKGIRRQLAAFNLQTEPWLFVIDRNGVISTRIEGAFSAEELRAAVDRVNR